MKVEDAHNAMQFMMRVQLSGQEVPVFNSVMVALQQVVSEQTRLSDEGSGSQRASTTTEQE
jgi:hypothetical protein